MTEEEKLDDSIQNIQDFFKIYGDSYSPVEKDLIGKSYEILISQTRGIMRSCGKPYFQHPLRVAIILAKLKMDGETIAAGLLHNVTALENFNPEILDKDIPGSVINIIKGTSKITELQINNKTLHQADSIRKMLFAMTNDIRVIIVKLADRLDRIRHMDGFPQETQKAIAQEIIDIWAPLANRLGMSTIKAEMEDLSLKHLNPEVFAHIKRIVAQKKDERSAVLKKAETVIYQEAEKSGIKGIKITSRAKHFWSIYQKMKRRNKAPEELFDLLAMRILCNTETDCYTLLGLVHRIFKPLEGRFKDYIAMPKANGYQSLHTTVMCYEGKPLEIQIRTYEMHYVAENGIASHWLYKKGTNHDTVRIEDLSIINKLKELSKERFNDEEFLLQIKEELLKDSIFVFTPKGDVIELPSGATAIDFAYAIHSAVGEKITSAKADGQIIPLSEPLKNTQVIEVQTNPNSHPTVNQLRFAKTSKARSKIRNYLAQHDDPLSTRTQPKEEKNKDSGQKESETKLKEKQGGKEDKKNSSSPQPLKIKIGDTSNFLVNFAKCCNPGFNDKITGYVSRGRGIIIHRADCKNLEKIPGIENRIIEVDWDRGDSNEITPIYLKTGIKEDANQIIRNTVEKFKGEIISGSLSDTGTKEMDGIIIVKPRISGAVKNIVAALNKLEFVKTVKLKKK